MVRKPPSGPVRVLVVDDDVAFTKAITAALTEDERLEVIGTAHDGIEALELAKRLLPDVMLLDLQMPKMDGVETLRRLKRRKLRPSVVVLTAVTDAEQLEQIQRLRPDGFLHKSVDVEEIVPAVAFTVAVSRAARALGAAAG